MKLMNRKFRVTRLEVLLNRFVGAALAAKNTTGLRSFAAKAAPTKTELIRFKFFSAPSASLR